MNVSIYLSFYRLDAVNGSSSIEAQKETDGQHIVFVLLTPFSIIWCMVTVCQVSLMV